LSQFSQKIEECEIRGTSWNHFGRVSNEFANDLLKVHNGYQMLVKENEEIKRENLKILNLNKELLLKISRMRQKQPQISEKEEISLQEPILLQGERHKLNDFHSKVHKTINDLTDEEVEELLNVKFENASRYAARLELAPDSINRDL
jgi:hypothetical protein